jgi:hypothetical protein
MESICPPPPQKILSEVEKELQQLKEMLGKIGKK